ncbi:MAG TPA: hypothetical protein VG166_07115, partial [Caulobacteraceae bacterium]|nr:hypothetical protein [Caulobacteraceae bacterium]
SQSLIFTAGSTGEAVLGGAFTGKVHGFSTGGKNQIDLTNLAFGGDTASYAGSAKGGTLSILDGSSTVVATIKFRGDYTHSTFILSDDGSGGTVITDPPRVTTLASAMAVFGAVGGTSTATATQAAAPTNPLARPGG